MPPAQPFGLRKLSWITGLLAFFISPVADNLTTALLMCAVVLAVSGDNTRFVLIACINIVVAANPGGAFSPFGDITTLMAVPETEPDCAGRDRFLVVLRGARSGLGELADPAGDHVVRGA